MWLAMPQKWQPCFRTDYLHRLHGNGITFQLFIVLYLFFLTSSITIACDCTLESLKTSKPVSLRVYCQQQDTGGKRELYLYTIIKSVGGIILWVGKFAVCRLTTTITQIGSPQKHATIWHI